MIRFCAKVVIQDAPKAQKQQQQQEQQQWNPLHQNHQSVKMKRPIQLILIVAKMEEMDNTVAQMGPNKSVAKLRLAEVISRFLSHLHAFFEIKNDNKARLDFSWWSSIKTPNESFGIAKNIIWILFKTWNPLKFLQWGIENLWIF